MPSRPMQSVCSVRCAISEAQDRKKAVGRTSKPPKPQKTRSALLKLAQTHFNRYIRLRDQDKPCISCDCVITGSGMASHYLSVGARPNLRFNEQNVHRSCNKCNVFLHGNLINYRIRLVKLIGVAEVEKLESDVTPIKLSAEDITVIIEKYRNLTKEMEKVR